jgi:hypothetical protein
VPPLVLCHRPPSLVARLALLLPVSSRGRLVILYVGRLQATTADLVHLRAIGESGGSGPQAPRAARIAAVGPGSTRALQVATNAGTGLKAAAGASSN